MSSNAKSPNKGVQYFGHFPKNFLRPYGAVEEAPSDEKVFARVTSFNCEWLLRPAIAMSEFASTMTKNLDILSRSNGIVNEEAVESAKNRVPEFLRALEKFDTKGERNEQASFSDLMTVVEGLVGANGDAEQFFENAVAVGGALFSIGIHYSVVRALFNNPVKFAELSRNVEGVDSAFKKDPSLREMVRYMQSSCLKTSVAASPARRTLLSELREISKEESSFQEASTSSAERAEQSPRKKSSKKHRKRLLLDD